MSRLARPQARWTDEDRLLWLHEMAGRFMSGSFTWDPPNINATTTTDTTLTSAAQPELIGLRTGMPVVVTPPAALDAGLIIGASWIPASNSLTIRLRNVTAAPVNQASGTWSFFSWIL